MWHHNELNQQDYPHQRACKATLRELARHEGKPMQTVLDEAIEHYQRERFLDEANAAYARLKSDPHAWKEELAERERWDGTLADGLEKE